MKTIIINIEDKEVVNFMDKLIKFKNDNCKSDEDCIKVENMRIEDYKQQFINKTKV